MSLARDGFESVGVGRQLLGLLGLLGFSNRNRVRAAGQKLSSLTSLIASSVNPKTRLLTLVATQCDIWIDAQAQEFLVTLEAVFEAPPLAAIRRDEKKSPPLSNSLSGFEPGLALLQDASVRGGIWGYEFGIKFLLPRLPRPVTPKCQRFLVNRGERIIAISPELSGY